MSFTRIQYDACAYNEKVFNSQKPMYYKLSTDQFDNCEACTAPDGPRNFRVYNSSEIKPTRNNEQNFGVATDIESLLTNRGYPNVRCMTNRTLEEKQTKLNNLYNEKNFPECDKKLNPIYSRMDEPGMNVRDLFLDRWEFPIIDPKSFVYKWTHEQGNVQIGRNTKLAVKDTYRPFVHTPLPPTAIPLN